MSPPSPPLQDPSPRRACSRDSSTQPSVSSLLDVLRQVNARRWRLCNIEPEGGADVRATAGCAPPPVPQVTEAPPRISSRVDDEVEIASCAASSPTSATELRPDLRDAGGVDHEPFATLNRCARGDSDAGDPCRPQLAAEAAELVTLAVIEPGLGRGLHGPRHAAA